MRTRLAEVSTLASQEALEGILLDALPGKTFVITSKEVADNHVPRFRIEFEHMEWNELHPVAAGIAWTEVSRALAASRRERADWQFEATVWPGD